MNQINSYRLSKVPKKIVEELQIPNYLCKKPGGMPFQEGDEFFAWLISEQRCGEETAIHYLRIVLSFLNFLFFQIPSKKYNMPVNEVREEIKVFLADKHGGVIKRHRNGNLVVTHTDPRTTPTLRLITYGLKHFYEFLIEKKYYFHPNPVRWEKGITTNKINFIPMMPSISGMTKPKKHGRVPEIYFWVGRFEWKPQLIDDPELKNKFLKGIKEEVILLIVTILFESGARLGEVLDLRVGDIRQLFGKRVGAKAKSKGSDSQRVKEIWWNSRTQKKLVKYLNYERRAVDPFDRSLKELEDSDFLFLNTKGRHFSYHAFLYHWQKIQRITNIFVTPHQVRHWYVTTALHTIDATVEAGKREQVRNGFIKYMAWKNPETIKVYDHHIQSVDFLETYKKIGSSDLKTKLSEDIQGNLAVLSAFETPELQGYTEALGVGQDMVDFLNDLLEE